MIRLTRTATTYTLGRFAAVGIKPLLLFFANNYLVSTVAPELALAFLASALLMVFSSAGPERAFYSRHYDETIRRNGLPFYIYVVSVLLLGLAGAAFCVTGLLLTRGSAGLALAVAIFFLSEKIADERLRWYLFERNLQAWGRASLARGAAQLLALLSGFLVFGQAMPGALLVLLLAIANVSVFRRALSFLRVRLVRLFLWLGRRSLMSLFRGWSIWLVALLTASVGYVDRIVVALADEALLALFSLLVMCFSVIQMAIDFYFLSRHRRDFLARKLLIRDVVKSREFLYAFLGGLIVASLTAAITLVLSAGGDRFPFVYVVYIALFQALMALALAPREIIYWSGRPQSLITLELVFWVLLAASGSLSWQLDSNLGSVLVCIVACGAVRLAMYLACAERVREPVLSVRPVSGR